jgi:integrase
MEIISKGSLMAKKKMLFFRQRRMRSGVLYYYFDNGPGKPETALGSDYVLAVREWSVLMAGSGEAAPVTTFIDLIDTYEKEEIPKLAKSTQATYRSDVKHLREYFSKPTPAPLDAIKPMNIKAMLKWKASQPTTANRLKRLFSTIFNFGRGEGYTDNENPCKGITGFTLDKREVDINEEVYGAVWDEGDAVLRDAMDLAEAIGQRPGDVLRLTELHIKDGLLAVMQGKTKAKRRIRIEGRLKTVLDRIKARKATYKVWSAHLTVNSRGLPLSKQVLRDRFETAREAAAVKAEGKKNQQLAAEIRAMWFYDLRAKAADDTAEQHGEQAAADLLGHDSVQTTKDHYLRRGMIVGPSK